MMIEGVDWIGLVYENTVAGFCEYCNELSGSMKEVIFFCTE